MFHEGHKHIVINWGWLIKEESLGATRTMPTPNLSPEATLCLHPSPHPHPNFSNCFQLFNSLTSYQSFKSLQSVTSLISVQITLDEICGASKSLNLTDTFQFSIYQFSAAFESSSFSDDNLLVFVA